LAVMSWIHIEGEINRWKQQAASGTSKIGAVQATQVTAATTRGYKRLQIAFTQQVRRMHQP